MSATAYFPPPDGADWQRVAAQETGFDPASLDDAVAFVRAQVSPFPSDLNAHLESGYFESPPDNAIIGPIRARGPANGLLLHRGRWLADWGDTRQVDPTFSVAKSYLNLLAGIAHGDGLIADLDAPVAALVQDGASTAFKTAPSPGAICCSRLRNGKESCLARPTGSIATAAWRPKAAPSVATARCRCPAATGNTTMSG
jgi:hypothetical protein